MTVKIGTKIFNKSDAPYIMGILNVTPDSFSDGGDHNEFESALHHAKKMIQEGADIIDIGGESTRPGSKPISLDEELKRTIPIIRAIREFSDLPISIDTTKSRVAAEAIDAGANLINDISAMTMDPEMGDVAVQKQVPICIMHMNGTPETMQQSPTYSNGVEEVKSYLSNRADQLIRAGVNSENVIVDPGIGFGKTVEQNLELINHLNVINQLGFPVLIGTSRKSFIGKLTNELDPKKRLEGTLATYPRCIENGVFMLRVHDVAETNQFLHIYQKIVSVP